MAPEQNDNVDEAKMLGVKKSKVSMGGFKSKGPADTERESRKQSEAANLRVKNRVAKAKKVAKQKPIDVRRTFLQSRFKAVRARIRPNNYSDALIKIWIKELEVIDNNPKHWIKETQNGSVPYPRADKKHRSARSLLDSMDLD